MTKHKLIYSVFLAGFFTLHISAQDNSWNTSISIGEASDNIYTKSLPAKYIATYPSDPTKSNSYSINGFVALNFNYGATKKYPTSRVSIFYELHKNTLIKKEQDVYQLGLSFSKICEFGNDKAPIYIQPEISIKFSEDREEQKKGLQYLAYTSFKWSKDSSTEFINYLLPDRVYPTNDRTNIPTDENTTIKEGKELLKKHRKIDWSKKLYPSDYLQIKHTHSIGLEHIGYEKLSMFNVNLNLEIYPFSGLLYSAFGKYQILKFNYSFSHRSKLNTSESNLFVGNLINKGVSLNYAIDDDGKTSFSLGYEHSDGGNPLKGLKDSTFGQLSIGAKINI
ncbi:hypothetical protein MC378_14105 [Polaribacter sp. MSW13]|uniref:Outer membrane protein beta-barrel domain-containing protein n=1 Tax=Polaribacter marinus TaxID=2916838 RepID=A0A9X2AL79_9FLAO|nr:hypothetical protein [Polaribacter marinus]MCI2230308.1 hypothetical protein [Polaribacter marinus]